MNILTDNMPLALAAGSFIAILVAYLAFVSLLSARKQKNHVVERAEKLSRGVGPTDIEDGGVISFFKRASHRDDQSIYSDTPLFYQRAGIYNQARIKYYQGLRIVLFLIPLAGAVVLHFLRDREVTTRMLFVTILLTAFGYYLPLLWLKYLARKRRNGLNRTFPDAMDLLMVCVEAGMGIDAAMLRVSREIAITSPELAKEFRILTLELRTGRPRNVCLKNLATRTGLTDVDNLVSLLIQADKYGTGVANALKVHAEEMRQRRYSELEEKANKLPVKLIIPVTLFIFPALFVAIMGPAVIQVMHVFMHK